LIILQLKSSYNHSDLADIEEIYSYIRKKFEFKIKGHEIHQSLEDLNKLSFIQRAYIVTRFCSENEIEYLTLHVPIPRNERGYIHSAKSQKITNDLILGTVREAEIIHRECRFKNKVVIVCHLPSIISADEIHYFNKAVKFSILEKAEEHLIDFYQHYQDYLTSFATLTLENVFPKYFFHNTNAGSYATVNMFHPAEMIRLKEYGIKTTLDFSHYNIYSNLLSNDEMHDNIVKVEREAYGSTAPSWKDCIDLLGESLIQLHISNSKGTAEGLMLPDGEIPLLDILKYINFGNYCNLGRPIQATIELKEGHLNHSKFQRNAVEWLLLSTDTIFQ
jgi:hypothetical protein